MQRSLQRNPTEKELAQALEVSPEHLRQLLQLRRKSLSLNHRVGMGEETELVDMLQDSDAQTPEAQMNETMLRQDIWQVLSEVLNEREQDIIALRYGLKNGRSHTLEEVSGMFNLSRERVRQIQAKAMRKLRRPKVAERLKGWLR